MNLLKSLEKVQQPAKVSQTPIQPATPEQTQASYDQIIQDISMGGQIKTTNIGANEISFAEYGAALSEETKDLIINSYDCPEDYVLQQQIAGIFRNDNCIEFGSFTQACSDMGFVVEYSTIKTTMIPDDKGDGRVGEEGNNVLETHHLAVYTITDPATGASIVVVDSNGNGAIETEELFLNQILQEVSVNIDVSNFAKSDGINTNSYSMFEKGYNPVTGKFEFAEALSEEEKEANERLGNKQVISQSDFARILNHMTEMIMNHEGLDRESAANKANVYVSQLYIVGKTTGGAVTSTEVANVSRQYDYDDVSLDSTSKEANAGEVNEKEKKIDNVEFTNADGDTRTFDFENSNDIADLNKAYTEIFAQKIQTAIANIENDDNLTEQEKEEKINEYLENPYVYIGMYEVYNNTSV